jgi:MFS family permease
LYDRANFRVLVTIAIIICAIGAGIFGLSDSLLTGLLARLFMGLGSAFAFLSVLTVAGRCFHTRHFALLSGIAQLLAAMGAIGGVVPIAFAVHHLGWRHSMGGLMLIGLVLALTVWVFLKKPKEDCEYNQDPQSESIGKSLHHIVKNTQTWWVAFYAFLNWAPVTAFASLWGVPFLVTSYQISTQTASYLCAFIWLGIGLSSPFIGVLSDKVGNRKPFLTLTALIGAVSIAGIIYFPNLPLGILGLFMFMLGVGSSGQILSYAIIQDFTDKKRLSASIGFNNMALVASGLIMQPLVGKLLSWNDTAASITQSYNLIDFQHALIVLPIVFLLCAVICQLFIKETLGGK